jgi:hypothetical protein
MNWNKHFWEGLMISTSLLIPTGINNYTLCLFMYTSFVSRYYDYAQIFGYILSKYWNLRLFVCTILC